MVTGYNVAKEKNYKVFEFILKRVVTYVDTFGAKNV